MTLQAIETRWKGYRFRSRLDDKVINPLSPRLKQAYERARSARFEHGETP